MPAIKGQCRCGAISYESTAEPVFSGVCHCRSCQKESGSAFNVVVAVPTATLSLSGTPKTFASQGDSGKAVVAKFCPDCGSTLLSEPESIAGLSIIRVGTLDDPSWVKPTMEIYCEAKQSWVALGGELQSFPKMPG